MTLGLSVESGIDTERSHLFVRRNVCSNFETNKETQIEGNNISSPRSSSSKWRQSPGA